MRHVDTLRERALVLLVDDCVEQRDLYELQLEGLYDIAVAGRGREAVEVASSKQPDVIVLDLLMPSMDGVETCKRLKGLGSTAAIPVIMLTGTHDSRLHDAAIEAGGETILEKPCHAETLIAAIRSALAPRQV